MVILDIFQFRLCFFTLEFNPIKLSNFQIDYIKEMERCRKTDNQEKAVNLFLQNKH